MKSLFSIVAISVISSFSFAQNYSKENVYIKQRNQFFEINQPEQTIKLAAKPFTLQFLNKPYQEKLNLFYAAQILVTDYKIEGNLLDNLIDEIPFFEPGTGFAAENKVEDNFPILSADGHHYLYYVSKEEKRINKIRTSGEWDVYEWTLNGVFENDKIIHWKDYQPKSVNFMIIVDLNLNGVVDEGEFHNIEIQFQ